MAKGEQSSRSDSSGSSESSENGAKRGTKTNWPYFPLNPGCWIGILMMAYCNPHFLVGSISSPAYPKQQGWRFPPNDGGKVVTTKTWWVNGVKGPNRLILLMLQKSGKLTIWDVKISDVWDKLLISWCRISEPSTVGGSKVQFVWLVIIMKEKIKLASQITSTNGVTLQQFLGPCNTWTSIRPKSITIRARGWQYKNSSPSRYWCNFYFYRIVLQ